MSPLGGYCATKFALVGLTEALRTELDGKIHVALVEPGVVDTPMAAGDPTFAELWPAMLNMPASWVVWADQEGQRVLRSRGGVTRLAVAS